MTEPCGTYTPQERFAKDKVEFGMKILHENEMEDKTKTNFEDDECRME